MLWTEDSIEAAIAKEIDFVAAKLGPDTAAKIREIVDKNHQYGRLHTYLEGNQGCAPGHYVRLVTEIYQQQHLYLRQVQRLRSETEWEPLYEQIKKWTFSYLRSRGLAPGPDTGQLAVDYAAEASLALIKARFPYDTEFDAWAVVITRNICARHMRRAMRKSLIPEAKLTSLEEEQLEGILNDLHQPNEARSEHQQDNVARYFKCLKSKDQKELMRLHYLEGISLPEIGRRMGKSSNAAYILHFRALRKIRKNLDDNGNNNK